MVSAQKMQLPVVIQIFGCREKPLKKKHILVGVFYYLDLFGVCPYLQKIHQNHHFEFRNLVFSCCFFGTSLGVLLLPPLRSTTNASLVYTMEVVASTVAQTDGDTIDAPVGSGLLSIWRSLSIRMPKQCNVSVPRESFVIFVSFYYGSLFIIFLMCFKLFEYVKVCFICLIGS